MRQRSKMIQSIAWWMRFVVAVGSTPRDGQGTLTFPNGATYVGEWKDGKWHGQGTWTHPNDATYVGEWQYDKRHGEGTMRYPDGATYVGEWKDGKEHGQGTYTLPDGRTYVGEWKDGKYHGQGTRLYPARPTYFTAFLRLLDTFREKADGMEMGTGLIIIWAILILVCLI